MSCHFAPHNEWNIKVALIAARILMQNHTGGDNVVLGTVLPPFPRFVTVQSHNCEEILKESLE